MSETELRPLRIAFMGYNTEQTRVSFRQFIQDNAESVKRANMMRLELNDGTIILPFPAARVRAGRMDGHCFDQLILADDRRKNIYIANAGEINFILSRAAMRSCVPEDFKVQFYNIDAPD